MGVKSVDEVILKICKGFNIVAAPSSNTPENSANAHTIIRADAVMIPVFTRLGKTLFFVTNTIRESNDNCVIITV